MTDFHLETVHELRNSLEVWRARLEEAESDLKYCMTQAAKARGIAEGAQQRVSDYERLLAVAETVAESPVMNAAEYVASLFDGCSDAQLAGNACADCGGDLTIIGIQSRSVIGSPLFVHSNPSDCKAVTS